jgi:hypothetical protein
MENGTPRSSPRAFYPDYMQFTLPEAKTPGWDRGPELRVDSGRTLRRVLGWSGIALAAFGLALPRGRARSSRLAGAGLLIAGMAAVDLLQRRRRSWSRAYGAENEDS